MTTNVFCFDFCCNDKAVKGLLMPIKGLFFVGLAFFKKKVVYPVYSHFPQQSKHIPDIFVTLHCDG